MTIVSDEVLRQAMRAYAVAQASGAAHPHAAAGYAMGVAPGNEGRMVRRYLQMAAERGITLRKKDQNKVAAQVARKEPTVQEQVEALMAHMRKTHSATDHDLVEPTGARDFVRAHAVAETAREQGHNLNYRSGVWHLDATLVMGSQAEHAFQLVSDKNGYIEFGACGDQHLASKYERLDCLNDYYDEAHKRGLKVMLNAGNWIDGEARFNMHDITVHGMDAQMQYLAANYPARNGMETWAIAGEDHEGWWARREGVDVGRYAERVMEDNGRDDWRNLGFMECFLPIVNSQSGKSSQLCVMHPGGGSSYALSYAPQKIVEGFDGGAKPAVLLIGHYHKASYQMTRNVHVVQTGCFQDQSLFMRQKKLAAHVGGWFIRLHVDPRTGAVDEFTSTFRNYFVKGFYDGRWSEHGPVNLPERSWEP